MSQAETAPEPRPASTVVLLREGTRDVETLLLRRNRALIFAGGFWVFPGGSVDRADLEQAGHDLEAATRIAAAREAEEEAGLRPVMERMVLLSHWTTPEQEPRRFATWFYAAPVASRDAVAIDGSEIHDARWIGIRDALDAHRAGELQMMPPTWVTLQQLARYPSLDGLLDGEAQRRAPTVLPVLARSDEGFITLYPGDAGYETGDPNAPGGRHRAVLKNNGWAFEFRDVAGDVEPLLEVMA